MTFIFIRSFLFFLLIVTAFTGYLTPEHIQQHIKRLIAQKYQLYVINLGNTINNNPLKAYVISGIKKDQNQLSKLTEYPATLITSYMHPRQPYSIKLMQKLLDEVLNNYQTDYFFKYMLDNTLLILFPFVNIDGYYRYKMLEQQNSPQQIRENYRKNMNKYGKCLQQWHYGVDINRNFDSAFGTLKTSEDQCGEQYRGPNPFSQKQSKAIKILFKKFYITLAIDIHSYGNKWVYPYASSKSKQKIQSNALYPIYQDLKIKLKEVNKTIQTCYQSLGYTADGVYIDWALDQGALSLAVQIGLNFNNDHKISQQILSQVQESFHIVLRKNSISYKKYINSDGHFIVQSTSLINFNIQVEDQTKNLKIQKILKAGKIISFPQVSKSQKIKLTVTDTLVNEQIKLNELDEFNTDFRFKQSVFIKYGKFAIVLSVISILVILGIKSYNKKQRQMKISSFSLPKTIIQYGDEQLDNKLTQTTKKHNDSNSSF